ncbi:protein SLOW WALKER 2 isoform X2 [Rhododendron vialii]|uniref:protein SLOW WALKER 2 isoform X2 n=1 Tax=Rhododendron vialii TaxID=182163 RepID=UPI00265EF7A2|nr:protein SLOW WALKER 2 isoform X2 [Rhododendron vialii]
MAISKSKKPEPTHDEDLLKSDVASFASSIGLSTSSAPHSGFNDSDFRKTGPIKPSKHPKPNVGESKFDKNNNNNNNNTKEKERPKPKPNPRVFPASNDSKGFDRFKNLPKLPLMKASALGAWHADAAELEEKVIGKKKVEAFLDGEERKRAAAKKKELAERLLAQYVHEFESSRGQSGDIKMLIATQRSGTATDKVSAFSVMVGENPVANLRSLDALLGMVTSKVGKRHALTGFEALRELFISSLLPDRKLKTLFQRPLNLLPESKDGYSLLLFWHWEECLKQRYERFVIALEEASRDMLPILKDKALKTMYTLLRSKSEQERRLLSALVNKLGDPESKAASNADFHLSKLLTDHPNMKVVVIDEVDNFLFRPHLGMRSKYHAVNFLSQIRLSHRGDGSKVAKRLVEVYFALFKVLISEAGGSLMNEKKRKEDDKKASSSSKDSKVNSQSSESHVEMDSRLLTALLTGVNRAFPFVSSNEADDIIEVQTPMLFQLVHSKNFNVGVQALMLLDKISSKNQIVSDRFFRALYSKLLLPAAMNSSKAKMFIGLLLRAMKSDVNLKRISAFSKRLLQVALQQPPQYACGCLFLLSEVLKARPPLWQLVLQNESANEDVEHFEDIEEETTDQKPMKSSETDNASKIVSTSDSTYTDGDSSQEEDVSSASDSETDVSDEEEDLLVAGGLEDVKETKEIPDLTKLQPQVSVGRSSLPGGYNPRHREPSYCNADCVSWWELTVLASHVHPSVATMARTLLSGANIVYNGNPLNDLSLTAFLDKLMEKKPKQSTWHGGSQIEPSKKLDMNNQLIGPEILSLAETDVPPEDLVFHKFYMNKMSSSKKPKKKKKKKGAEDEAAEELYGGEEGDDESDNEEIDNMLDSVVPSIAADGEYDYDDLDQVAVEDDDDLVGNVSDDEEIDVQSDIAVGDDDDDDDADGDDIDDDVDIGDADDGSDEEEDVLLDQGKRKRKSKGRSGASPFASLEEYEHLLDEDSTPKDKSAKRKNSSSKKKRKKSK